MMDAIKYVFRVRDHKIEIVILNKILCGSKSYLEFFLKLLQTIQPANRLFFYIIIEMIEHE